MNLLGTQHAERYENLKRDIEPREAVSYYYTNGKELTPEASVRLSLLTSEMMTVGPFGPLFLRTTDRQYKPEINGIPLQNIFERAPDYWDSGITLNAFDIQDAIILENEAASLLDSKWYSEFTEMRLTCITAKLMTNSAGRTSVCGITAVTNLCPIGYYAHPANNRVAEGMSGSIVPERSLLSLGGNTIGLREPLFQTLMKMTALFNEYHDQSILKIDFTNQLLEYFDISK